MDTGSSTILIRLSVCKKLNLKPNKNNTVLKGFSGNLVVSEGSVTITISVDDVSAEISVTVIKDNEMMYECILGRDFLDLPHIMLLKINETVHLKCLGTIKSHSPEIECGTVDELELDPYLIELPEPYITLCKQLQRNLP